MKAEQPRIVSKELIERLDSVERVIAERFLIEKRWILKED